VSWSSSRAAGASACCPRRSAMNVSATDVQGPGARRRPTSAERPIGAADRDRHVCRYRGVPSRRRMDERSVATSGVRSAPVIETNEEAP
jgi:hypothetical protein